MARQFPPEWYAHQAARRKNKGTSIVERRAGFSEIANNPHARAVMGARSKEAIGKVVLSEDQRKEYGHIKDIDKIRPRYFPTPKTGNMSSSEGTRHFDLYTQDQANDIMVDKYGVNKGHSMWQESINHGGAMYRISSNIANEKLTMLRDLKQTSNKDFFNRSYLDIWNEWSPKQGKR